MMHTLSTRMLSACDQEEEPCQACPSQASTSGKGGHPSVCSPGLPNWRAGRARPGSKIAGLMFSTAANDGLGL